MLFWGQMWVKVADYPPGGYLGMEHTCDGADLPPSVQWGGAPPQTQVYVLRMYDPDAPADTFIHWIVYNISTAKITGQSISFPQGYNDFGRVGYGGPCPPAKDPPHRYVVEVYALKKPIVLSGTVTWERLRSVMGDKVIDRAETFVIYKRQKR